MGRITQTLAQAVQPSLVDGRVAGHLHRFDRLARGPLEVADETAFPWSHEQNRFSGASSPARPADAVHVGLAVERHVVVDHQADALHIETPRCNVGGHKDVDRSTAQPLHGAFPLVLGNVAIEHRHLMATGLKGFGHGQGDRLGAGKDDHTLTTTGIENPLQGLELVRHRHRDRTLTDPLAFLILGADRDLSRILEITLGQATDLRGHRRGEQHHLTLLRKLIEDPLHIVDEAHAEHFVRFIEHQAAQTAGVERALTHVVHHPAGGAHHHINPAPEGTDLGAEIRAAVHRQHLQMGMAGGIGLERFGHLHRQLPCGGEHEGLGCFLAALETLEQRQGKGCCFAGAGLGLTHQIAAEHQLGEGRLLNGGRFAVSLVRQGAEQGLTETKTGKTGFRFSRCDGGGEHLSIGVGFRQVGRRKIHCAGGIVALLLLFSHERWLRLIDL